MTAPHAPKRTGLSFPVEAVSLAAVTAILHGLWLTQTLASFPLDERAVALQQAARAGTNEVQDVLAAFSVDTAPDALVWADDVALVPDSWPAEWPEPVFISAPTQSAICPLETIKWIKVVGCSSRTISRWVRDYIRLTGQTNVTTEALECL